jgi:hypothetical protein
MSHITQKAKDKMFKDGLGAGTATWRARFFMTNSTIVSQKNVNSMSAYTDPDPFDGVGAVDVELSGVQVVRDDANNKVYFICESVSIGALAAGTRRMAGVTIYLDPDDTNTDSQNIPLFVLTGGFPKTPDGGPFSWTPADSGGLAL